MTSPIFDHTLPLEERVKYLLSQLKPEEKIGLLPSRQAAVPGLGIKAYSIGAEGAHGLLVRKHHDQWPCGNSTVFPQPIGLSCTWDKDLLFRVGDVIGTEARIWYEIDDHSQWLTLWFPTIDMERDPRWGRNEEAYGEDPYLAGKLAANLIRGVQGDHPYYLKATCAPKHFYGNNMEKDRLSTSTNISERVKQEYYLRVFEYAFVEGKAFSVMAAYNEINGVPCLINPENVEYIREKWGCEGYIVSDGDDLPQMVTHHHYCETQAEAIALAIKAGADCFPVQKDEIVTGAARTALEKGLITEGDIDRAVANTFRTRFRLGQFDPKEVNPYSSIEKSQLCDDKHSAVAFEAAHKSVVLLKNDGLLPLDPEKCGKVLVVGDLASKNRPDWYSGKPPHATTPLAAIQKIMAKGKVDTIEMHDLCVIRSKKNNAWLRVDENGMIAYDGDIKTRTVFEEIDWGFNSVSYRHSKTGKYLNLTDDLQLACKADAVWGWFTMELFLRDEKTGDFLPHSFLFGNRYDEEKEKKTVIDNLAESLKVEQLTDMLAPIANAARKNDTVIIALGNHPLVNGRECFDRPSLELSKRWKQLIEKVSAVNKNIILLLIAGYPYAFPNEEKCVRAVMHTAHGEQDVGSAVADTLFGRYNPAGRLSQTWYLSENDLPPMDNYDIINHPRTYMYFDKPVQYPFGFGLSYTEFEYSDIKVSSDETAYTVSCNVKNVGDMAGDEVVQLYAELRGVPVKAPIKKLCGFERVNIEVRESKTVTFNVPVKELRLFDEKESAFSIAPKSVTFAVGASSADIRCEAESF